jgi:hypothetical protein
MRPNTFRACDKAARTNPIMVKAQVLLFTQAVMVKGKATSTTRCPVHVSATNILVAQQHHKDKEILKSFEMLRFWTENMLLDF